MLLEAFSSRMRSHGLPGMLAAMVEKIRILPYMQSYNNKIITSESCVSELNFGPQGVLLHFTQADFMKTYISWFEVHQTSFLLANSSYRIKFYPEGMRRLTLQRRDNL